MYISCSFIKIINIESVLPQFAFHALSRVHQSKISQKPLVGTFWQILATIQDTRDVTKNKKKKQNKQTNQGQAAPKARYV